MFRTWRHLPPVFEPALSRAKLTSIDQFFWLGDGILKPNDQSPLHWHDTYEMGIILSGCGVFALEDQEYPFVPGQVYIIDDGKPHMAYAEGGEVTLYVAHFLPQLLRDTWVGRNRSETQVPFIPDFIDHNGPMIPLDDECSPAVAALIYQLREEGERRAPAWEVIANGLILQVIGHLARRQLGKNHMTLPDLKRREALQRIRPILHLIEESFAESLTLDDMARAAFLSRSHCCALFQQALNTTPVAYRNQRRLSEARKLLQSTELTIREIAFQVGFSSVQEFNRLFLRESKATPTEYRKRFYEMLRNISS